MQAPTKVGKRRQPENQGAAAGESRKQPTGGARRCKRRRKPKGGINGTPDEPGFGESRELKKPVS
jgi:hypothetical protein